MIELLFGCSVCLVMQFVLVDVSSMQQLISLFGCFGCLSGMFELNFVICLGVNVDGISGVQIGFGVIVFMWMLCLVSLIDSDCVNVMIVFLVVEQLGSFGLL